MSSKYVYAVLALLLVFALVFVVLTGDKETDLIGNTVTLVDGNLEPPPVPNPTKAPAKRKMPEVNSTTTSIDKKTSMRESAAQEEGAGEVSQPMQATPTSKPNSIHDLSADELASLEAEISSLREVVRDILITHPDLLNRNWRVREEVGNSSGWEELLQAVKIYKSLADDKLSPDSAKRFAHMLEFHESEHSPELMSEHQRDYGLAALDCDVVYEGIDRALEFQSIAMLHSDGQLTEESHVFSLQYFKMLKTLVGRCNILILSGNESNARRDMSRLLALTQRVSYPSDLASGMVMLLGRTLVLREYAEGVKRYGWDISALKDNRQYRRSLSNFMYELWVGELVTILQAYDLDNRKNSEIIQHLASSRWAQSAGNLHEALLELLKNDIFTMQHNARFLDELSANPVDLSNVDDVKRLMKWNTDAQDLNYAFLFTDFAIQQFKENALWACVDIHVHMLKDKKNLSLEDFVQKRLSDVPGVIGQWDSTILSLDYDGSDELVQYLEENDQRFDSSESIVVLEPLS